MFSFIFTILFLSLGFFSAENLAITIGGGFAAFGLTHWIKTQTGAMGLGAMVFAVIVSIVVAVAAIGISMLFSEDGFSFDKAAASAMQVFAVATIAYKTIMAD